MRKTIGFKLIKGLFAQKKLLLLITVMHSSILMYGQDRNLEIKDTTDVSNKIKSNNVSTSVIDELPSFAGGKEALGRWMALKLRYPQKAAEYNIQGDVVASFLVNVDGKLSDIKIEKSLGYDCDEEVLRIIRLMPKWVPAKLNGQYVQSRFTLPVNFAIKNM